MSLQRGDVVKVLKDGICPPGAHPFVILAIEGNIAIVSNLTDIENEGECRCILEPGDDHKIITLTSTFLFRSIKEWSVATIENAIKNNQLRYCGQISQTAFSKIIAGSQLPNLDIKEKYKHILKPVIIPPRIKPTASLPAED
jgi:hypothetical protein